MLTENPDVSPEPGNGWALAVAAGLKCCRLATAVMQPSTPGDGRGASCAPLATLFAEALQPISQSRGIVVLTTLPSLNTASAGINLLFPPCSLLMLSLAVLLRLVAATTGAAAGPRLAVVRTNGSIQVLDFVFLQSCCLDGRSNRFVLDRPCTAISSVFISLLIGAGSLLSGSSPIFTINSRGGSSLLTRSIFRLRNCLKPAW
jgi:hypothetical protein